LTYPSFRLSGFIIPFKECCKLIPPVVFPNYRSAGFLPPKLIGKGDKLNSFPELALLSVSRSSVLFFTVGVGAASIASLGTGLDSAVAQMSTTPDQKPLGERTISQVNVLFVNPSVGDDTQGKGGEQTPLKTIAHALRLATANTVIMLSPGTYSAETGEVFPLILKAGVSIQGDASTKGKGISIQGGGDYLSRSFGSQNVTIVGANQAGLSGVTVTNSNPRGYGLWIESSNPIVTENTFIGSTQDGISITGNAAPTIRQNYFYRNGANGMTIGGNSQAQVRENIFEQTGFGINIAQNAAPVVVGNQILHNRSGIVVQANARPILRSNLIQGSKEDGVVAIAQAMPDLGTPAEPGGNQFQNNGRYDINASAAKQLITAAGNTLANNRITGKLDILAPAALIARNPLPVPAPLPNRSSPEIPVSGEIVFSAPGVSETDNRVSLPSPSNNFPKDMTPRKLNSQLMPLQPANASPSVARVQPQPPASRVPGFPTPNSLVGRATPIVPPISSRAITTPPLNLPPLNFIQIDPNSIEYTTPKSTAQPPLPRTRHQQQPLPKLETTSVGNRINPPPIASILPVPSSNIPMGNTRNMAKVAVPETYPTGSYGGSLPYATATRTGSVRYRVLVEVATEKDQELVRYLAPGAFSTVSRGRNVMQAGVFSNQYNADGMMRTLNSNGLQASIELLN
jgi:parallel beta-helix repeat protein